MTNNDLQGGKESYIKTVQAKISQKEGTSEVLEKQKISIYKRDSEPRLPESRIIDYENNTISTHQQRYKSQIESQINARQSPIITAEISQVKPQIISQSQQETTIKAAEIIKKTEHNVKAANGLTGNLEIKGLI